MINWEWQIGEPKFVRKITDTMRVSNRIWLFKNESGELLTNLNDAFNKLVEFYQKQYWEQTRASDEKQSKYLEIFFQRRLPLSYGDDTTPEEISDYDVEAAIKKLYSDGARGIDGLTVTF